jgi:SAM-dependent methyltransferase
MLTEYVLRHAAGRDHPLKVLEFGCGVGRHLRNLRRVPNTDVYGYDQSETMAHSIIDWSRQAWFDEHIRVGEPTGRLPYDDGAFDIVYTAEVLVHVRPEHLHATLEELLRVSRGHVFHLEASPTFEVRSDVHDGCWKHNLPETYRELGRECQVIEGGYSAHWAYRVIVNEDPSFTWDPVLLSLFRDMERMIDRGFDVADAALRKTVADAEAMRLVQQDLQGRLGDAEEFRRQVESQLAESRESAHLLQEHLVDARASVTASEQRERTLEAKVADLQANNLVLTRDLESTLAARLLLERELTRKGLEADAESRAWKSRLQAAEQQLKELTVSLAEARSRVAYIVDRIDTAIRQPGGEAPRREGA